LPLKIYNTLSKNEEIFEPLNPPTVKMYVCGPTVYDLSHLGHARTYIAFDVVRRYLEFLGYSVVYVVNITDVEDKIIKRAQEKGVSPFELAEEYTKEYFKDIEALQIKKADINPKVTEHIEDIIEVVQGLIDKGYAYVADGDVYFDVLKFPDYGKLSHQSLEDLKAGARVEVSEKKKHPADFALWKKSKEGEPSWGSPWGPGRPGWHIECSVMSMKYLGEQLDIHGGGQDLIFPHHENEIAQSEAYTGKKPFAKYWMHTGLVMVRGERMGKSLGNFVTIKELLEKFNAEAVRLFVLSTHYRSPIDFTWERIEQAKSSLERLYNTIENIEVALRESDINYAYKLKDLDLDFYRNLISDERKFFEAMNNDFNTPAAISALFELSSHVNNYLRNADKPNGALLSRTFNFFMNIGEIFGLFNKFKVKPEKKEEYGLVEKLIALIVDIRSEARKRKDWETADKIREKLRELGIFLEDTKEKTIWKLKR